MMDRSPLDGQDTLLNSSCRYRSDEYPPEYEAITRAGMAADVEHEGECTDRRTSKPTVLCERHCEIPGTTVRVSVCTRNVIHKFFRGVYKLYSFQCVTTYKISSVILSNRSVYDWIASHLWTIVLAMFLNLVLMSGALQGVKLQSCRDITVEHDLHLNRTYRYTRSCRTFFTFPYILQCICLLGFTFFEGYIVGCIPIMLENTLNHSFNTFVNKTTMEAIMLIFIMSIGSAYLPFQTKYSIFKFPAVLNSFVWCSIGVTWIVLYDIWIGIPICNHKKDPQWMYNYHFPLTVGLAVAIAFSFQIWIIYSSNRILTTRKIHLGDEVPTLFLMKFYHVICLFNLLKKLVSL